MAMASIGSFSVVEDNLRISSEDTSVSTIVVEMGLVNTEVFHGSSQANVIEAEKAECECCRLVEECTPGYIAHVKGLHCGRWVCGLCAEAIKEEHRRSGGENSTEGLEEALKAHMIVCMQFNKPERMGSPVADITAAVRRLLRRNTDACLSSRSTPSSPQRGSYMSRANSCFGSFPKEAKAPL